MQAVCQNRAIIVQENHREYLSEKAQNGHGHSCDHVTICHQKQKNCKQNSKHFICFTGNSYPSDSQSLTIALILD